MTPALCDKLAEHGVTLAGGRPQDILFGIGRQTRPLEIESPVQLRPGRYDVGRIGAFTYLGGTGSVFRHISSIGRFCSIAGSIEAGSYEHPTDFLSTHPLFEGEWRHVWPQLGEFYTANAAAITKARKAWDEQATATLKLIEIGNDVWIGQGAFIRRGVRIGDGAIVAARAVVVSDVPPYTIVGGTPARVIRPRFEPKIVERLLNLRWWEYGTSALLGCDFTNPSAAIDQIQRNIRSGQAVIFSPPVVRIAPGEAFSITEAATSQ